MTTLLSDKQVITASAVSDNVYDAGLAGTPYGSSTSLEQDLGKGNKIPFLVQVTETLNPGTSITFQLEVDSDVSFGSPTVVISQTVLTANLIAGKQLTFDYIPKGVNKRFFRMNYTVTGDATTGSVTAGVTMGNQENMV